MSSVIDPENKTSAEHSRPSDGLKPANREDSLATDTQTKDDSDLENSLLSEHKANKKTFPKSETADDRVRFNNISYWAVGWLTLMHVVVLIGAPLTFTWTGLGVMVFLHWVTGSLGICLGFHRMLTHTGMKTHNWVRNVFATIGTLAGEGSPLDWVADHRKHHALSDQEGDPHSPHDGGFWSHMYWLAFHTHNGDRKAYLQRWVPDLYKEKYMRSLDILFLPLHILSGFVLYGIGYAIGGTPMACIIGRLGHVHSIGFGAARNLDGQQCFAYLGLPKLRNHRRQSQQLVGSDRCVWRRLAQQPPRLSTNGQARTPLVRVRHHLASRQTASRLRIGLGCRRLPQRGGKESKESSGLNRRLPRSTTNIASEPGFFPARFFRRPGTLRHGGPTARCRVLSTRIRTKTNLHPASDRRRSRRSLAG